jgi:hypothetical protein
MAVKIGEHESFEIFVPTSGGKAGKGLANTSNVQVRRNGVIVKQFRFKCDDEESRKAALRKAGAFIRSNGLGRAT